MCILLLNIILMVLISLIYLIFKIFYGKIFKEKRYMYFMEKILKKKYICIYLFGFKNKVIYMAFLFQNILNK